MKVVRKVADVGCHPSGRLGKLLELSLPTLRHRRVSFQLFHPKQQESQLLTDIVMPGRTGPQLAADARVRFPDLPVLFMSGYAGEAGKRADIPPEDLVRKPFDEHELLERIEEKISQRSRAVAG